MSDPTTANLILSVPTNGSDINSWDVPVNGDMTILDACAGSVTSKALTNANVTLSTTESQVSILRFTGTLTGNVVITLGAVIKSWVCENNCLGAFTITVKGNPGTGNVVGLPPGSCQIYWDGTNVSFVNLGKVGELWEYIGAAVPAWVTACTVPPYLNCDGTTFSAVTYPLLNLVLGGTTLPDSRGRFRATLNQTTGRITSTYGPDGNTNLSGGGAQSHTMTPAELVAHVHASTYNLVASGGTGHNFVDSIASGATGWNTGSSGSTTPFSIVPPSYIGGITLVRAA